MSDLAPILLALAAGFGFALGSQLQYIGLAQLESRAGTAISICATAAVLWGLAPFFLDFSYWTQPAALIFVAIGLFRPALSANLSVAGMRYLGPTLSSTLSATSPLFGATFGILILGEVLSWPLAVGIVGVVTGVIVLSRRDSTVVSTWPLWALGLPIAAAVIRSFGHVLSKIGMESIPDPYFAALATFTVSALVTSFLHLSSKNAQTIKWRSRGPWWFVIGGVVFTGAVVSLNAALKLGEVVTVAPIVASSPVFTMLLSIFIFRRERISPRIVASVFIVVMSVIFISLSR